MQKGNRIDAGDLIDNAKFGRVQWFVLFWCAYIIIFDGYDLAVLGVVLPILMEQWQLTRAEAGLLASYTLLGMMIGALTLGPLSDRVGRIKVIGGCVIIFSIFTFLCGFTTTPTEFAWCRLIAGFGLGGAMPNVTSLTSEYSPKVKRSMMVGLMFSGYSIGGIWAVVLGILIVPTYGWQIIFYLAIFPLLFLPFMMKQLPESAAHLIQTRQWKRLAPILEKVAPQYRYQEGDTFFTPSLDAQGSQKPSITQLFTPDRRRSTLLFGIVTFMSLYVVYGMTSWLPKLMFNAGYPLKSSLIFLLTLHSGTILGAVSSGWLMDRMNGKNVLVLYFFAAFLAIASLGFKPGDLGTYSLLLLAGATTIGTQIAISAYVARFYPPNLSSTGLGMSLGVGRLGAIVGPYATGVLVDMQLSLEQNFFAFAIPSFICAVGMLFVNQKKAAEYKEQDSDDSVPSLSSYKEQTQAD